MRLAGVLFAGILLLGACKPVSNGPNWRSVGDPEKGKAVIAASQCGACHDIPGVAGADGQVGPSLAGFANRTIVAGVLPNTPDNLGRWLRTPQLVKPGDAMPDTGLDKRDAADVAVFLYSLR